MDPTSGTGKKLNRKNAKTQKAATEKQTYDMNSFASFLAPWRFSRCGKRFLEVVP
jgi:hypothetical protein